MRIGMVGMGRMGGSMARRLLAARHEVVAYDVSTPALQAVAAAGAVPASSLEDLVARLPAPRAVWLMLPASLVQPIVERLEPMLARDDVVIDGGNSYHPDDLARAHLLAARGIEFVDVGVSGGVWGARRGYCLMIGGSERAVSRLQPIFAALAPGLDAAPRTDGRESQPSAAELGYLHCGPVGAGHFVKMVHNGIEYGMMAALAEGFNVLYHAQAGKRTSNPTDAETAPLRHPELYQYEFDLGGIAELWRRGSVISSWLLDLIAHALLEDPGLGNYSGRIADSGEGRWTLKAATDEGVGAPVLAVALSERFASRGEALFADKLISAMRHEFGGHRER